MGALKSKPDNEGIRHDVWTVLPHHMGGGPHGLGNCLSSFTARKTVHIRRHHAWVGVARKWFSIVLHSHI